MTALYCPSCKESFSFEEATPPYSAMHLLDSGRHIHPITHEAAHICPLGHEYTWVDDEFMPKLGGYFTCVSCNAMIAAMDNETPLPGEVPV